MKTQKLVILTLIAIISIGSIKAQQRDSSIVRSVIIHGLNDSKNYVTSPLRWTKKDWVVLSGITASTGALIAWGDEPIYRFSNTLHHKNLDVFFQNTEPLGNIYPAMAIGAIMLKGFIQKDNYAMETSLIALESYVISGLFNRVIKATAGRNRPNNDNTTNAHQWEGPFFNGASFFSGHTTTAFSVASVFAYRYKDTGWVSYVAYGLATIAGLERIYDNRHWTSDVLMGAAVGTATGIFLSKQWEDNSIRFFPTVSTNGGGLSMIIPIK